MENCLALVLDSCLHVFPKDFGNSAEDAEVISIDVSTKIDSISWSKCTSFVFLALNNGSCQLVHIPTRTPLPPLTIIERKIEQINDCDPSRIEYKTFLACWIEEDAGLCSLFLCSIDGVVSNQNSGKTV